MAAWHRPPLGLPLEIPQLRRRVRHSPQKDRRPRPHRQRPLQLIVPPHKAQLMPPRHRAHPHSHRPTTVCWWSAQWAWPWCVMAQEILLGIWLGSDFVTTTVGCKRHRALLSYARVRAKRSPARLLVATRALRPTTTGARRSVLRIRTSVQITGTSVSVRRTCKQLWLWLYIAAVDMVSSIVYWLKGILVFFTWVLYSVFTLL